jgi:hypothetical protein
MKQGGSLRSDLPEFSRDPNPGGIEQHQSFVSSACLWLFISMVIHPLCLSRPRSENRQLFSTEL